MSSRVLELEELHLKRPRQKLKLSVQTSLTLDLSPAVPSLSNNALVKALMSGNLWANRGSGLRLEVTVAIDGQLLGDEHSGILQVITSQIRDAPLWSQLGLLTSVVHNVRYDIKCQAPHFSISLNHGAQCHDLSAKELRPLDRPDVIPPDAIPRVELRVVQTRFDFYTIEDASLPQAPSQSIFKPSSLPDVDLLGVWERGVEIDRVQDSLEGISTPVSSTTGSIPVLKWPESPQTSAQTLSVTVSKHIPPRLRPQGSFRNPKHKKLVVKLSVLPSDHRQPQGQKAGLLESIMQHQLIDSTPKKRAEKISILNNWMEGHRKHPYPSRKEKKELMEKTGYARHTLNNELHALRRKLKSRDLRDLTPPHTSLLLESPVQDMNASSYNDQVTTYHSHGQIDSEMLLPPTDWRFPSNLFDPFIIKNDFTPVDQISICKLTGVSLRQLIGGSQTRGQGIKVKTKPEQTSLSLIVPSLFNPGFQRSMVSNSLFLTTISNAFTRSLIQNVQGVSLRKKLSLLADCNVVNEDTEIAGSESSPRRLGAVINSRIWAMMHRNLYDPVACRNLFHEGVDNVTGIAPMEETEDIVSDLQPGRIPQDEDVELFDRGYEVEDNMLFEDEDEFEDLLLSDDEYGLLHYLEEYEEQKERSEIERNTEEMLFGNGSEAVDDLDPDGSMLLGTGEVLKGIQTRTSERSPNSSLVRVYL